MTAAARAGILQRVPDDHSSEVAADAIRTIAALLERYGVDDRAEFVRSMLDTATGEIDWLTITGLEFWGGSGAVWEVEPFEHSHPADERSVSDSRAFYGALVRLAEELEVRGMSELSGARLGLLRTMAAGT